MGVTTFPCPRCGQQQRETHENGQAVQTRLCAACQEAFEKAQAEIIGAIGSDKQKEKAIEALEASYHQKV